MSLRYTEFTTPLGNLRVGVSALGVRAVGFVFDRESAGIGDEWTFEPTLRHPAVEQLNAYFDGALRQFDLVLDAVGTPFQKSVWNALLQIPMGETSSYASIARRLGKPTATRAVGGANGANPIAIIVPCHRIIGKDGTLTGYAGGTDRKRWLLTHEHRLAGRQLSLVPESPL